MFKACSLDTDAFFLAPEVKYMLNPILQGVVVKDVQLETVRPDKQLALILSQRILEN